MRRLLKPEHHATPRPSCTGRATHYCIGGTGGGIKHKRVVNRRSHRPGRQTLLRREKLFNFGGVAAGLGFFAQVGGQRLHFLVERECSGPAWGVFEEIIIELEGLGWLPGGQQLFPERQGEADGGLRGGMKRQRLPERLY